MPGTPNRARLSASGNPPSRTAFAVSGLSTTGGAASPPTPTGSTPPSPGIRSTAREPWRHGPAPGGGRNGSPRFEPAAAGQRSAPPGPGLPVPPGQGRTTIRRSRATTSRAWTRPPRPPNFPSAGRGSCCPVTRPLQDAAQRVPEGHPAPGVQHRHHPARQGRHPLRREAQRASGRSPTAYPTARSGATARASNSPSPLPSPPTNGLGIRDETPAPHSPPGPTRRGLPPTDDTRLPVRYRDRGR